MVVFGKKWLYSVKVVVFGQSWLYLGKVVVIRQKNFQSVKNGCVRAKVALFGQK